MFCCKKIHIEVITITSSFLQSLDLCSLSKHSSVYMGNILVIKNFVGVATPSSAHALLLAMRSGVTPDCSSLDNMCCRVSN